MADIFWTGTGDGTSWSDAANWDSGIVPTVLDNVTVNVDVNITTNVDIQVTQLNLLAGTLTSTGNTSWGGNFEVAETASIQLSGETQTFAIGTIFNGLGTVELASGALDIDDQVSIQSKFKTNSNSQVKVKNNLKLEGDTEISGLFDLDETAIVELSGQTHNFASGCEFSGLGVVNLAAGELNVDEQVIIKSKFKSNSNSQVKVKNNLKLEGDSEIGGACDIAENGSLELIGQTHTFTTGSSFTGVGILDFISGELSIADEVSIQSKFKSKSTLKVQNKLKLEGESEISGACDVAENASLELSGQTHTFAAGSAFTGTGVVDFISGELNVTDEVSIQSKFNSKSTLKVQNKLTLENDSEISGVCEIADNATLEFAQGEHVLNPGTSFTGEGKLVLSDGTLTVNDTINANIFEVTGGTVTGAGQIIAETQIETLGATLSEGKTKVITNEFLQVTDADTSADEIVYTLTDLPDAGALLLNGVTLDLNATFTQADIDNNLLTYADGTSVSLSDSFGFDITVNGELITSSSFGFEIGSGSIAEFRDTGTEGIFAFTDASASATLKFSVDDSSNPSSNNEIGVFAVDDDKGTINGIAPGSQGYLQAALSRAKVISSVLENEPNGFDAASRLLEFQGSDRLGFYLVTEGTTDMALAELAGGKTPSNISFSTSKNLQVSDFTSGSFTLNWEEQANGGNGSFKDVVLNVESVDEPLTLGTQLQANGQGEVLDLRSLTGQASASFTISREAQFDNVVGLYAIQNEQGAVLDKVTGQLVNPGDANYAQIAIQQRLNIDLSVANQGTANLSSQLDGGVIFAPFIIADATVDEFLAGNPNNTAGQGPQAYFAFLGANSDGADHVSLLGNNTFGFEDLPGAGDKDYNDIVLKIDLTVA
jgi:hypothetical protein